MVRRFLIAWAAVALAATCVYAQARDSREVQRAREGYVGERGKKVHYSPELFQRNLDSLPQYQPEGRVAGTIRIAGLNYIGNSTAPTPSSGSLVKLWEEGFLKYHPNVKFSYNLASPLFALPAVLTGVADLGATRPITWDELMAFQRSFNYDPLEIAIATGSFNVSGWGVTPGIFVHKKNPISKLTLEQLDGIFGAQRTGGWQGTTWHPEVARSAKENIRTWGQLGLTAEWKNKRINVYAQNHRYHRMFHFERVVFKGGDNWNEDIREFAAQARPDGTFYGVAEQIMDSLGRDPYGIAFSHLIASPHTKAVALAAKDGGPFVELTIENVQNRTYPMFTEWYFYLNRAPGRPLDPKLKEYLKYLLSRDGQEAVVRDGKYLPLTAAVVREQLKKLE